METILAQTLTDWELIVCDSYSDDGAWEFFQRFTTDARVHLSQFPRGLYQGWNRCLEQARGEYVYIATSDDTAKPDLLEKLVAELRQHPDVDMATCNFAVIDEANRPFPIEHAHPNNGAEIYGDWLDRHHRRHGQSEFVAACMVGQVWTTVTSALFRRSLFAKTGLFPIDKGSIADFEWALRACLLTDTVHLPEELATWRIHHNQATHNQDRPRTLLRYPTMVSEVFRDCAARLPSSLGHSTTVQSRLAQAWRTSSYNSLKLRPTLGWTAPGVGLNNLWTAMRHYPELALSHLFRGGRWKQRPQVDLLRTVEQLLTEFQLPPICCAIMKPHE